MIDKDKLDVFYDTHCIVYSSPEEEEEAVVLGIKLTSIWDYRRASKLYGVSYGATFTVSFDGDDGVYVTYEEAKQLLGFSPIWCSSS